MKPELFFLDSRDNVGIAFSDISAGAEVQAREELIICSVDIPKGHKVAVTSIAKGAEVIKYGASIGRASSDIKAGDHVHVHNVATSLSEASAYVYEPDMGETSASPISALPRIYRRKNGKAGIRNELWVIPTVGCVNGTAELIVQTFRERKGAEALSRIDGVFCFTHPYGCSQLGEDHERTRTLLQNMAVHPNAGGVLILGLGCENNQIREFRETMDETPDPERIRYLISQEVEDEIEEGVRLLEELYEAASGDERTEGSWSDIIIGLECGGSDAFSGITANPLIGEISDRVIASGGSAVLTEVPEMFGAENALMAQCPTDDLFNRTAEMIDSYKHYYLDHHQPVYENPSPGNKKGGITTLEDKSLGCIRKSGTSPIIDVVKMDGKVTKKGLSLLYSPGNDIVATTTLGTSGCQLVLFSTGRGTPLGGFIPTFKISSNSQLAGFKNKWIDFNAGMIADGECSRSEAADLLVQEMLEVINGRKTAAEKLGIRQISLFKSGVTL